MRGSRKLLAPPLLGILNKQLICNAWSVSYSRGSGPVAASIGLKACSARPEILLTQLNLKLKQHSSHY